MNIKKKIKSKFAVFMAAIMVVLSLVIPSAVSVSAAAAPEDVVYKNGVVEYIIGVSDDVAVTGYEVNIEYDLDVATAVDMQGIIEFPGGEFEFANKDVYGNYRSYLYAADSAYYPVSASAGQGLVKIVFEIKETTNVQDIISLDNSEFYDSRYKSRGYSYEGSHLVSSFEILNYGDVPVEPEPVTEPVTEPATEPITEPATEPVTEPETEPVTEPATEPITEPATEPVTEPTVEPVTEPVTEPATEPVTEPTVEPVTEPATEPATEPVVEPVTEPATEPATEPVVEPVTEPATEPATEPVVEPVTEPATEPTAEPSPVDPTGDQTDKSGSTDSTNSSATPDEPSNTSGSGTNTSSTGGGNTTGANTSSNSGGAVQTGQSQAAILMLLVISLASAIVAVIAKKRRVKNE
jgi:hypothetical protein